ncbi:MAG: hypothetical protein Q7S16_04055, partial [bacterium]|nr:hypothetical protein [bacterium]
MSRIFSIFRTHTTDRLHDALVSRSSVYEAWHEHPYHPHVHWGLFVMFIAGWGFGLAFHFFVPTSLTYAATYSFTTAAIDDSSSPGDSTIRFDASGYPVIGYYDSTSATLKVMHCNDAVCAGGNETINTVNSSSEAGRNGMDMVLDASG